MKIFKWELVDSKQYNDLKKERDNYNAIKSVTNEYSYVWDQASDKLIDAICEEIIKIKNSILMQAAKIHTVEDIRYRDGGAATMDNLKNRLLSIKKSRNSNVINPRI
jgi:hypothetical protein